MGLESEHDGAVGGEVVGGWEHLAGLGARGRLGCGLMVGCCWVPAGDAGMAGEEGERVEGRGVGADVE